RRSTRPSVIRSTRYPGGTRSASRPAIVQSSAVKRSAAARIAASWLGSMTTPPSIASPPAASPLAGIVRTAADEDLGEEPPMTDAKGGRAVAQQRHAVAREQGRPRRGVDRLAAHHQRRVVLAVFAR